MRKLQPGINDLATTHPELARQADGWDPRDFLGGSHKKKDWICAKGHRWEAQIKNRALNGIGCPICSNKKVLAGYNDLATVCPEVAKEADGWDPKTVTAGSWKLRNWKCKYGHTWPAKVGTRTPPTNAGCPYCSGNKVWEGFNDLQSCFPSIACEAFEWDPRKINRYAAKTLKWKCPLGHIYPATVESRTISGNGCPYCSGRRVLKGFNDLQTTDPEIAKEADGWDPQTVTRGSGSRKTWRCPINHTYPSVVSKRSLRGDGCPYCSGRKVLAGFNDLATTDPGLAKEANNWDPSKFSRGSHERKTWRCEKGHTWQVAIKERAIQKTGCPYCSGNKILVGFNDLSTTHPEIASEADDWDPTTTTEGCTTRKKWICKKCGNKWRISVNNRTANKSGCPECAESGYKTNLPGWFYLMERPGEQQLGITNNIEKRMKTHARNGWIEIDLVGPFDGKEVLQTEKRFKYWLRHSIGLVPGTAENWFTSKMEVRSLKELKEKSNLETNLF